MNGDGADVGLPIEEFIQALTSQLDRAQSAMALKARAGLPLTFAVKDLSIDLRTHVDVSGSVVRIRPAGPGEAEASILHLGLTTITRPMIDENAVQLAAAPDEPSLKEVLGKDVTEDERRRLEWAGVYTVSQLRSLERQAGPDAIERVAQLPVERLRRALQLAATPRISRVVADGDGAEPPLLGVHGHNLMEREPPVVRIDGRRVPVMEASPRRLLVRAEPGQLAGMLSVENDLGGATETRFDLAGGEEP